MAQRKGLTWSGKWHIIREGARSPGGNHDVGLCGAYLYSWSEARMPSHLQDIVDGRKTATDCKLCAKRAGNKTAEQILAEVRELAETWDNARSLDDGRPNVVAQAFAAELRKVVGD